MIGIYFDTQQVHNTRNASRINHWSKFIKLTMLCNIFGSSQFKNYYYF